MSLLVLVIRCLLFAFLALSCGAWVFYVVRREYRDFSTQTTYARMPLWERLLWFPINMSMGATVVLMVSAFGFSACSSFVGWFIAEYLKSL